MGKFTKFLPYALMMSIGAGTISYGAGGLIEDYIDKVKNEKEVDIDFANIQMTYYDYIDAVANKISSLSEKRDIVGDFALYETMLENGYISYGTFEYSTPLVEDNRLMGASVAMGSGVCRNEAWNMCDVFNSLGYEAKVVIGMSYKEGEEKPDSENHAVVYVSDGDFSYILDPTMDTILLRKSFGLYITIESQEDDIRYFKPSFHFENDYHGECNNLQLLGDLFNDHKKHWLVLKAYKNYKEAAKQYLVDFSLYEKEVLSGYEQDICDYYVKFFFSEGNEHIRKREIKEISK